MTSHNNAYASSNSHPPPSPPNDEETTDSQDNLSTLNPTKDPEMYVFYKTYNAARDMCINGSFTKEDTSEEEIEKFIADIIPTISGGDMSDSLKRETAEDGVRQALKQFGVIN
ncbi:unnamed protein product [Cochlearia groenlandica]